MNPIEEILNIEKPTEVMCKTCKGFGCNKCEGEGFIPIKNETTKNRNNSLRSKQRNSKDYFSFRQQNIKF